MALKGFWQRGYMMIAATSITLISAAVPRMGTTNRGALKFPAIGKAIGKSLMAKILLIEDDGETAEEITAELVERGFEVEWSADGKAGLATARSSRPDAIVVDRMLPGMDGLSIIETLRKEQVRTPVLVLSALGAVDDRVRGLRAGGGDFLTKP